MEDYEVIDISWDAGIKAFGGTLEDLFVNAARGMYSLMTDPGGVSEKETITIEVESHSLEGLLVSWLNELIFRFDAYGFVGKEIRVKSLGRNRISAEVSGEEFDEERHEKRLLVKAATYHQLRIEQQDGRWVTRVIFDI